MDFDDDDYEITFEQFAAVNSHKAIVELGKLAGIETDGRTKFEIAEAYFAIIHQQLDGH